MYTCTNYLAHKNTITSTNQVTKAYIKYMKRKVQTVIRSCTAVLDAFRAGDWGP
jgi:hypothetical protein